MHRWIQHVEKPLGHLDYTNLATQICISNHSSPDFGQNRTENFQKVKNTAKQSKGKLCPKGIYGAWAPTFGSNNLCNVPTLGHHHSAEIYDDQSSQMDVIASTGVFERHCGVQLALIIIFHHYEPFRTGWLWFRCIPTISMILTILSYKLIEITEEVILGTLLGGTSQCNSSLESGGATLQDGMARSDFQWPGKPQGEIRSFSEVKRLIN
jgi:hypothetical protein